VGQEKEFESPLNGELGRNRKRDRKGAPPEKKKKTPFVVGGEKERPESRNGQ